jgi:hypothetical protein
MLPHSKQDSPCAAPRGGMSRWALTLSVVLLLSGLTTVAIARRLGKSGSRPSVFVSVVALWIAAWALWSLVGGLAARYGVLDRYDGGLFGVLAVTAGAWQYRTQVRQGRERGLTVFLAAQILWLVVVMVRNGALAP